MSYNEYIDSFYSLKENLKSIGITDLLFYEINTDGNEEAPNFSLINKLDLESFSVILGGGLNQKISRQIYQTFSNKANDLSLCFSNCLYQHELENLKLLKVLGPSFSQHRLCPES